MEAATLLQLLSHEAFESKDHSFSVAEAFDVSMLLATQTGSSIAKIREIRLDGQGCQVTTAQSTYLLPVSHVFGLRVEEKTDSGGGRTGFRA